LEKIIYDMNYKEKKPEILYLDHSLLDTPD